jgi:hypothetical protein
MTDDLLREASDPNTPGERLAAVYAEAWKTGDETTQLAALGNPSYPPDQLKTMLASTLLRLPDALAVWFNPAVPLLLLSEPLPEYRRAARLLRDEFAEYVARVPYGRVTLRDFDRHLAGLFGSSW